MSNIRGGGEFGAEWHRGGMLEKKQNSFDDFIASAEWLIANKYTRPSRLAIVGSSNGGMLVCVAALQRPDLFRAVISRNTHLDMLRYHKFMKAAPWVREYGNPDVADEFVYLRKYSPYHNIREGVRYPAMLLTTGDGDTRVAPLHSRKMTARMQAAAGSGSLILLRYDLVGGHTQSGSRKAVVDQMTDEFAFLHSQLGIVK
jgi:prolyl oligopeptidase